MVNCSAKGGKILRNHWYKEPQGWYKSDAILILKAKLFLINKKAMHHYLKSIKVTKRNFNIISERIRYSGETKIVIPQGNPNKTPNIQYSKHLEEKPVNV